MSKRILLLAAAILAVAGIAVLVIWWRSQPAPGPGAGALPALPAPQPTVAQPPPSTPEEVVRAVELDARRTLYSSLRSAFEAGKPLARSRERLQPVLKRLWPGPSPTWSLDCRERICRIEVRSDQPPETWRSALQGFPAFAALVDRFGWDPDGRDPAAYALLAQEGAADGVPVLEKVSQQVLDSPALRRCLADPANAGTLDYELEVDDSGITFLRGGDVHSPLRTCFEDVLSEVITSTPVSAPVHTSRLKITVRGGK
jgi:hypothetical protein